MDIYFENLIWKKDGKLDDSSPVRWVDSPSGKNYYGDYKAFLAQWSELSSEVKKNTRFFLASKQLMSIKKTNEIKLVQNSPIRVMDYFPLLLNFFLKKKATYFFDYSGKNLLNFNDVLSELEVKKPKLFAVGLGISWKKNLLIIYPSETLVTFRYGFSDFISFPINIDKDNTDLENQLKILINSLGKFKKIKILRNNKLEYLISNALTGFDKEFETLKADWFLPELVIEKTGLDWKKRFFKLYKIFFNQIDCLLKLPKVGSFLFPILITVTGLFTSQLHDAYLKSSSLQPILVDYDHSSTKGGSLAFLDDFINQSKSLTTTEINSIELKVKQKSGQMVGIFGVGLNKEFASESWLQGISNLGKDADYDRKKLFWSFDITYPQRKKNTTEDPKKIIKILEVLLEVPDESNETRKGFLISMQSQKKIIVSLDNQSIEKLKMLLIRFQKKQLGWDWVHLRFTRDGMMGLTNFYGVINAIN